MKRRNDNDGLRLPFPRQSIEAELVHVLSRSDDDIILTLLGLQLLTATPSSGFLLAIQLPNQADHACRRRVDEAEPAIREARPEIEDCLRRLANLAVPTHRLRSGDVPGWISRVAEHCGDRIARSHNVAPNGRFVIVASILLIFERIYLSKEIVGHRKR